MKKIFSILFLFLTHFTFSQGEANNWIFGYNAGVSFNSGSPSNISNPSISLRTEEGCSAFSDSAGNLLFYSDGNTVWNSNNDAMPNGSDLLGNASSTQSAMVIPKPGSATQYYIFTVGSSFNGGSPGFNYYTIDMTADGGLGDIIAGPVDLSGSLSTQWTEKVAAVKGADCDVYWVISYDGTNIKSFKVDLSGVNTTPVSSVATPPDFDPRGYLKVSPNGKKLAIAHFIYLQDNPGGDSSVMLYDFDDLTGSATNGVRLFDDPKNELHPYGLEFSRESTKLYTSTVIRTSSPNVPPVFSNSVYQYDLESTNIAASETLIHSQIGFRGGLQIAPDGKIYATVPDTYWDGTHFLDVINNPDQLGSACGYQEDAVDLGSGYATQGLPPFISSIFSPIEITGDDGSGNSVVLNGQLLDLCEGDNMTVSAEPLTGMVTYEWTFNGIVKSTTENLILTNITSADIGDYKLEVTSIDICGRASFKQGFFSINSVSEIPIASPITAPPICDDNYTGTYAFDLDPMYSSLVLNGQDPTVFEVKYYASQTDADDILNELPIPYNSGNTTIFARIQNINNDNCYVTTSFDINIYQSAQPLDSASIIPLEFCDNTSVGTDTDGLILFDLGLRETEILNGQSPTDFTLTYFADAAYSLPSISTPTTFQNTIAGGQTVYVRVTNNLESNCYADTSFEIEVFELPDIQTSMNFTNCDGDGTPDGFTDFNLNEATDFILNGNTDLNISYHITFADADIGSNPINPFPFNNSTASTVYARAETLEGCYRISTVDLNVLTVFPTNYTYEISTCDDDDIDDGLYLFDLTEASADIIAQFPTLQNPIVQYYRNITDAQLEQNEILPQTDYMSETPFNQTIYVRVENDANGDCFGIGPYLNLTVYSRPKFEVEPTATICVNLPPITLETFNPDDVYSYEWTDQNNMIISLTSSAAISSGGIYTVIATSGLNCESFPHTVTVIESDIADIDIDDITITDDSENNTVTINNDNNNLGSGDYEFSMNDEFGPYQDEPFFDMVAPGIHIIYVRDKNECGITFLEISVIGFPKFFTPNNDGYNDNWQILGVNEDFYPTSLIYIYDRFGKIIAKVNPTSDGWNGYYNGQMLPSDDYWYSVQLTDNDGVSRNKKGHFSLIRR